MPRSRESSRSATSPGRRGRSFPATTGAWWCSGKAVPEQADTASMLVQLNSISKRSQVAFRGISLSQGRIRPVPARLDSSRPRPLRPAAPRPRLRLPGHRPGPRRRAHQHLGARNVRVDGGPGVLDRRRRPATEASAATLPIGAVVGPGGLPTLPYDLTFRGGVLRHLQLHRGDRRSRHPAGRRDAGLLRRAAVHRQRVRLERRRARLLAQARRELPGDDLRDARGAGPDRRRHTERPAAPSAPGDPQAQPASAVVSK